jgi:hypothetical protein
MTENSFIAHKTMHNYSFIGLDIINNYDSKISKILSDDLGIIELLSEGNLTDDEMKFIEFDRIEYNGYELYKDSVNSIDKYGIFDFDKKMEFFKKLPSGIKYKGPLKNYEKNNGMTKFYLLLYTYMLIMIHYKYFHEPRKSKSDI